MTGTSPPMDPSSSEATKDQLDLALVQGRAYGDAVEHMVTRVAHDGGSEQVGPYEVGYAVEDAEGMYHLEDGELVWHNPQQENTHLEIVVRDAADGRFVPCLDVRVELVSPSGERLGPERQELVWHPMMYHYGKNWTVPEDGEYTVRVHIDPPSFMRHDEINGRRFAEPVEVELTGVKIQRGAEPVEPPE
ncbi:hypothetical protein GCM10023169_31030 [Georgenia halophila]|uniref:Fe2+ transport protein n=1 Tax=Georgenia halophila TaxID=620889 RepID=A0ABP8LGA5_9MICO